MGASLMVATTEFKLDDSLLINFAKIIVGLISIQMAAPFKIHY
jgi:hypothetical protein